MTPRERAEALFRVEYQPHVTVRAMPWRVVAPDGSTAARSSHEGHARAAVCELAAPIAAAIEAAARDATEAAAAACDRIMAREDRAALEAREALEFEARDRHWHRRDAAHECGWAIRKGDAGGATMGSGERLSDDEIAAIAARAEAATPGPWRSTWGDDLDPDALDETAIEAPEQPAGSIARMIVGSLWHNGPHVGCSEPNATFIAHARTDVPRLLGELARLRAVEVAAISARELEGGPGEAAALEDLRAALRGGQ